MRSSHALGSASGCLRCSSPLISPGFVSSNIVCFGNVLALHNIKFFLLPVQKKTTNYFLLPSLCNSESSLLCLLRPGWPWVPPTVSTTSCHVFVQSPQKTTLFVRKSLSSRGSLPKLRLYLRFLPRF